MGPDAILARRLATQRLTSSPAPAAAVVRELLAVQAQEPANARAMLGLRAQEDTDAAVRAVLDSGAVVRTHVLRPTWHFVAADDLRWLLALTSPKVISGMGARHRQLGVEDPALQARALDVFAGELQGRRFRTRTELGAPLATLGLPANGPEVGHLLLLAELRGLLCSGPMRDGVHTYGLVDEIVPPTPSLTREEAMRELVRRFVAGHGPVDVTDLQRWTPVTRAECATALAELGEAVASVEIGGRTLWYAPSAERPADRPRRAFLLSMFDEADLSYKHVRFPRAAGHPLGAQGFTQTHAGGGAVVLDRIDVGVWKRTVAGRKATLGIDLVPGLFPADRQQIAAAADDLVRFFGVPTTLTWA